MLNFGGGGAGRVRGRGNRRGKGRGKSTPCHQWHTRGAMQEDAPRGC